MGIHFHPLIHSRINGDQWGLMGLIKFSLYPLIPINPLINPHTINPNQYIGMHILGHG